MPAEGRPSRAPVNSVLPYSVPLEGRGHDRVAWERSGDNFNNHNDDGSPGRNDFPESLALHSHGGRRPVTAQMMKCSKLTMLSMSDIKAPITSLKQVSYGQIYRADHFGGCVHISC